MRPATTARSKTALSSRLRSNTNDQHTAAEQHELNQHIMNPNLFNPQEYVVYLQQLFHIYQSLENRLASMTVLPALAKEFEKYNRTKELTADIKAISPNAKLDEKPLPATQQYLDTLEKQDETILMGDAYVRVFADLSGGQIIHSKLKKVLSESQLSFYHYTQPTENNQTAPLETIKSKNVIKDMLDEIPETEHEEIITAAKNAFTVYLTMFDEIQKQCPPQSTQQTTISEKITTPQQSYSLRPILLTMAALLVVATAIYNAPEKICDFIPSFGSNNS